MGCTKTQTELPRTATGDWYETHLIDSHIEISYKTEIVLMR